MPRRFFRCLNKIADRVYQAVFLFIFLFGIYALYDTYMVYYHAVDTSVQIYKPDIEHPEEMKALSEDVVAWLTVDGTEIDHPIMQGEDNNEYLSKDPYGAYSLAGSLFLDARNKDDFSDEYSLIYGHHMEGGAMFGALDLFLNREYFDEHKSGTLMVTDGKCYSIDIFAVLETSGTNENVFAPNDVPSDVTMKFLSEHAVFKREKGNGNLIAMSTCKYPATADRIVVFGTLEETDAAPGVQDTGSD